MTLNKALLQHAVGMLAPSVRSAALQDAEFAKEAGYRTNRTITFQAMPFDAAMLAREVTRLYRSGAPVKVRAENGIEATLDIDVGDRRVVCITPARRFGLPQLCVFSPDPAVRLKGLEDVPEFGGLLAEERAKWRTELSRKAMAGAGFLRLLGALKATPVAHALRLASPSKSPIRLDEFAPTDPLLMRRAIGSYSSQERALPAGLGERQRDWVSRDDPLLLQLALSTAVRSDMGLVVPADAADAEGLAKRIADAMDGLDPFSRVAAIEHLIAAAAQFANLNDAAAAAVAAHVAALPQLEDDLKIFAGVFLMAQAQLSSEATREASWRHRRAFAWTLACSATRGLSGRIEAAEFFPWTYNELGHRYRIAVALDKHAAPRWGWSDGDPGQLRSEMLGRLFIASGRFAETSETIGLAAALEDDKNRADANGSLAFWFMPAPLEGEMPARKSDHRAPIEIERASLKRLSLESPQDAFAGACNIAKLRVPRAALAAATERRLEQVTVEQTLDDDGHLQNFLPALIHFAGITKSAAMADKLIELLVALVPRATPLLMNAIVQSLLECASVPISGRAPESVFAAAMRRVTSAASTTDSGLQIEHLLRELLRHRPSWKGALLPLVAASELSP